MVGGVELVRRNGLSLKESKKAYEERRRIRRKGNERNERNERSV